MDLLSKAERVGEICLREKRRGVLSDSAREMEKNQEELVHIFRK